MRDDGFKRYDFRTIGLHPDDQAKEDRLDRYTGKAEAETKSA